AASGAGRGEGHARTHARAASGERRSRPDACGNAACEGEDRLRCRGGGSGGREGTGGACCGWRCPGAVMKKDDIDNTAAPLIEHLAELRTRLIRSVLAFVVCMIVSFAVAQPIFNFLAIPLMDAMRDFGQRPELIYTGLQQGFMVQVRISIFGGFVLAFPIIAHQLWRFVAPGLYRQEKRAFLPFLFASPILFLIGATFAYLVVLPFAFRFFLGFQQFGADFGADLRELEGAIEAGEALTVQFLGTINEYLGLTMQFIVAFGLCFQLPVLL